MVPLPAGGSQLWRALRRLGNRSVAAALTVVVVLGGLLGHSSLAGAQAVSPGADPSFFPVTGYRIASPALLNYFQRRGGVRTFGYPVSNEFPLLGTRVQIFQRHMLQLNSDGTVTPAAILDPSVLPISHIDGLNLPAIDDDLAQTAPHPEADDFAAQALAFTSVVVPDTWNDLPVNFLSTYFTTVSCADAFGTAMCDQSLLPAMNAELWGLPTSLPTADPQNPDFVYQRFQRGIMHFSRATGQTQGLLVGDWLKRVMVGVDLSADLGTDVRRSRFYAQYAPSRPLALDRPGDLPDTSLAQAFRGDSLSAAGQRQADPTLPANVASTATAVAMTATAVTATQIALTGTQVNFTATALAGTATALANQSSLAMPQPFGNPSSFNNSPQPASSVTSTVPVVNIGCMGDEQMWFVPPKPRAGVHVQITVTSQRHHDIKALALAGPVDPGAVIERIGPFGFMWTWTVQPLVEDFYQWTFYADGLRPCITSGFNAYTPLGASPTPTKTPRPTDTPGPTATPTATVVPIPTVSAITPSDGLACNSIVTIRGTGYGSPPSSFGTTAFLINGTRTFTLQQIGTGSSTQVRVQMPSTGVTASAASSIQVSNSAGDSNLWPVTFSSGC